MPVNKTDSIPVLLERPCPLNICELSLVLTYVSYLVAMKKVENYVENRELEIRTLQKSKKPEKEATLR